MPTGQEFIDAMDAALIPALNSLYDLKDPDLVALRNPMHPLRDLNKILAFVSVDGAGVYSTREQYVKDILDNGLAPSVPKQSQQPGYVNATPPTIVSATIEVAVATDIIITFDVANVISHNLVPIVNDGSNPYVSEVTGATLTLTFTTPFTAGEVVNLTAMFKNPENTSYLQISDFPIVNNLV